MRDLGWSYDSQKRLTASAGLEVASIGPDRIDEGRQMSPAPKSGEWTSYFTHSPCSARVWDGEVYEI